MAEIDFITAFGRLLRDGKLRDAFAASPQAVAEQINLNKADWPAWQQLVPADLEFQASVLLRKRLDLVKFFIPETCRQLGEKLWPVFNRYARVNWPAEQNAKLCDAFAFCQQLKQSHPDCIFAAEWNRLSFALSKQKVMLRWVAMPVRRKSPKSGLQLFLRGHGRRWREFFFYLGF